MTHRQFLAWRRWLRDQWNEPSRTDHYLMVLACEVRRVLSQHPGRIQPADFKLAFSFKKPAASTAPGDRQRQAAFAKAKWFLAVGYQEKDSCSQT